MIFRQEHIAMILNGTKTATRRNWKKPMVIVGHSYPVKSKMLSKETHCRIKILKVYKQRLREMQLQDAKKEGYPNLKEFYNVWDRINGMINFAQEVYVVEFVLDTNKAKEKGK